MKNIRSSRSKAKTEDLNSTRWERYLAWIKQARFMGLSLLLLGALSLFFLKSSRLPGGGAEPAQDKVSPYYHYTSLLAGAAEPGLRDGSFEKARFRSPQGLLLDRAQWRLIVADSGNGLLREVSIADWGQTKTLEFKSGGAKLIQPSLLAWVKPGKQFIVYDFKNSNLALADLETKELKWIFAPNGPGQASLRSYGELRDMDFDTASGLWVGVACHPGFLAGELADKPFQSVEEGRWGDWCSLRFHQAELIAATRQNGQASMLAVRSNGAHVNAWLRELLNSKTTPKLETQSFNVSTLGESLRLVGGAEPPRALSSGPVFAAEFISPTYTRTQWLPDEEGRRYGVDHHLYYAFGDKAMGEDNERSGKVPMDKAGHGVYDAPTATYFVSDDENHRLVAVRDLDFFPEDGLPLTDHEFKYPEEKLPGVTRIVVQGNSQAFDSGSGKRHHFASFSKRLEVRLNQMAMLEGAGRRFEIIFVGTAQGHGADGLTSLGHLNLNFKSYLEKLHPDMLLFCQIPEDFIFNAQDFGKREAGDDGLPGPEFDPGFLANKGGKIGAFQDVAKYLNKHPFANNLLMMGNDGLLYFSSGNTGAWIAAGMKDEELRERLFRCTELYVAGAHKKSKAAGLPMAMVMLSARAFYGIEEQSGTERGDTDLVGLTGLFRDLCEQEGLPFYDAATPMNVLAVSEPLVYNRNAHPTPDGHDRAAFVTAWRLIHDPKMRASAITKR